MELLLKFVVRNPRASNQKGTPQEAIETISSNLQVTLKECIFNHCWQQSSQKRCPMEFIQARLKSFIKGRSH